MTVADILKKWLEDNGYDGLWRDGYYYCCCRVEDLMPCEGEGDVMDCQPGYIQECDCGEGCDYHIGPRKDEKN